MNHRDHVHEILNNSSGVGGLWPTRGFSGDPEALERLMKDTNRRAAKARFMRARRLVIQLLVETGEFSYRGRTYRRKKRKKDARRVAPISECAAGDLPLP
jgi:hypothetical protein